MGEVILALDGSIGSVRLPCEEEGIEGVCVRAVEHGSETLGRKFCRVFFDAKDGCNLWNT